MSITRPTWSIATLPISLLTLLDGPQIRSKTKYQDLSTGPYNIVKS